MVTTDAVRRGLRFFSLNEKKTKHRGNVEVGLLSSNAVFTCRQTPRSRRRRQYVSPKRWHLPTSPHGVTIKKTNVIFTAVRTSDLKQKEKYSSSFICYLLSRERVSTLRPSSVPTIVFNHHLMDVEIYFNITRCEQFYTSCRQRLFSNSILLLKYRIKKILRLFKYA
jgi:hypothetical protein